jgi:lipopolysaccharide transport system ATP-binding protein
LKPILEIKDLSKKFQINSNSEPYLSLRENAFAFLKPSFTKEAFWALKDVNFDVMPGDTLGIIGKNGAGKSTLLKILSKITPPTSGSIKVRGRIASLLEVGTGFHLELSGRENIFFNGSILGMKKSEIQKNFDGIVDFSGVEKFLDTPLKHYSSGMQLRLAFAVSAFLENEILVIDEVLAVGDAEFQKKCMGKMKDVSKSGRTILFVSHNLNAIVSLCEKSLYLKNGSVVEYGLTNTVLEKYLALEIGMRTSVKFAEDNRPGDSIAKLVSARVKNIKDETIESTDIQTKIGVEFVYEILEDGFSPLPNLHVFNFKGETAFFGIENNATHISKKGVYKTTMWIPENTLNTGKYIFGPALSNLSPLIIHFYEQELLAIDVFEDTNERLTIYKDPIPGIVRPTVEWLTQKIN